jgi:hypothetical protein
LPQQLVVLSGVSFSGTQTSLSLHSSLEAHAGRTSAAGHTAWPLSMQKPAPSIVE